MLHLYDANNHFRRLLETDRSGLVFRNALALPGIWVWDAPDGNELRRRHYPRYKTNRPPLKEDLRQGLRLMRKLLSAAGRCQVCVPGWEADDVIASIARIAGGEVTVHSTDRDLRQLALIPGVTVTATPMPGVEDRDIRLYKTLVGDPSDGIRGVPGFGRKAWTLAIKPAWHDLLTDIGDGVEPRVDLMPETPRIQDWLSYKINRDYLLAIWNIVGLFGVPYDVMARHTTAGPSDRVEVERLLAEVLQ